MDEEAMGKIFELTKVILHTPSLQAKQGEAWKLAELIYKQGYRKFLEDNMPPVLKPELHSESIGCPHCGEEFGIEMEIEMARETQRDADVKWYKGGNDELET